MGDSPLCVLHFPELHAAALRGVIGTDKAEADAEAKKEQRRKAKSNGKKPKPAEGWPKHDEGEQSSKPHDDGWRDLATGCPECGVETDR